MSEVRAIVNKMFAAFDSRDLEGVISTFSEDASLVHHGTQVMPAAKFKGKEGARMFFEYNFNAMKVVYFNKNEYFESGDKLFVIGNEHFIFNHDGSEVKNSWIQIYTVTNGLISKMEEFASSATPEQYGGNAAGAN